MNTDPFTAVIREAVRSELAAVLADLVPSGSRPALLTTKELAHELRCCTKTVDRLRKDGLPHVTIGDNAPRYRLDVVLAWLESRPSATVTEGQS
jgi:hypothetical protein